MIDIIDNIDCSGVFDYVNSAKDGEIPDTFFALTRPMQPVVRFRYDMNDRFCIDAATRILSEAVKLQQSSTHNTIDSDQRAVMVVSSSDEANSTNVSGQAITITAQFVAVEPLKSAPYGFVITEPIRVAANSIDAYYAFCLPGPLSEILVAMKTTLVSHSLLYCLGLYGNTSSTEVHYLRPNLLQPLTMVIEDANEGILAQNTYDITMPANNIAYPQESHLLERVDALKETCAHKFLKGDRQLAVLAIAADNQTVQTFFLRLVDAAAVKGRDFSRNEEFQAFRRFLFPETDGIGKIAFTTFEDTFLLVAFPVLEPEKVHQGYGINAKLALEFGLQRFENDDGDDEFIAIVLPLDTDGSVPMLNCRAIHQLNIYKYSKQLQAIREKRKREALQEIPNNNSNNNTAVPLRVNTKNTKIPLRVLHNTSVATAPTTTTTTGKLSISAALMAVFTAVKSYCPGNEPTRLQKVAIGELLHLLAKSPNASNCDTYLHIITDQDADTVFFMLCQRQFLSTLCDACKITNRANDVINKICG